MHHETSSRALVGLHICAAALILGMASCTPSQSSSPAATPAAPPEADLGDPGHSLLKQMDFDDGVMLPWMISVTDPAKIEPSVKEGALCLNVVNGGEARWDAQVRHREMIIQKDHVYNVSFKVWADKETDITGKIGMSGPPYSDYWTRRITVSPEPAVHAFQWKMALDDDPTAEFSFHVGGEMLTNGVPTEICFDDIVLSDPEFVPPPPPPPVVVPTVRVNQLGYVTKFEKLASVVNDAKEPLDYKVLDSTGKVVAEGKSTVFGVDPASKDHLHTVDFSNFKAAGEGFVLEVDGDKSDPFKIAFDVYTPLKLDAFRYFYLNRSGLELTMPFTGKQAWARPAGHAPDKVKCAPEAKCDYELDVTGGWYDAGDYGKYVVNGGIAVWTLMDLYERARDVAYSGVALGDKAANIPESGNKVDDALDEARWEMDFLLSMQVPDGNPHAGMAHHKVHDVEWTALGHAPHEDAVARALRPVSTAATLNLAATAAQAARVFKASDKAYSEKCLAAAERAWAAAKKNPKMFAPASDTKGGGPYDDDDVSDEFYWAAAELYITTGKVEYKQEFKGSKLDGPVDVASVDAVPTFMTWQRVDGLGKISLAVASSRLPMAERRSYRDQIVRAADVFVELTDEQGYHLPLSFDEAQGYPWGSNSFVLNNALVMALAYDFTKDAKYRRGTALAMDYILGRNAMGKSYVTGYGERPLEHPHHRFWSQQASPGFPAAPPGAVSGGPNSGLEDPYVQAAGLAGCVPQKCYLDNIEAWSTNEITINWNAPLTWVAAWLDERAKR